MADSLDFSHHVQQIPAGAELPQAVQTHTKVQVTHVPDFQSAASNYAASTNWMSSVGSAVATRASNAIATKMGNEAGKNPRGDIFSITDFDKTFAESYQAQAGSTLGLQAHKLITDANIEMAKSPRLSADLIAKTNNQVSLGLKNIFANAPTQIKPQLESQYGASQISLAEQATDRMIGEQRDDMKHNNAYSSQINAENAHALMMSGKPEAAQAALDATIKSNNALAASGIISKDAAKVSIDTARKSMLNGKYSRMAEDARAQGKEAEFFKNLADKKPDDLSDADYPDVANAALEHMNQLRNLRSQDEQIYTAKMNVSIAKDVMGITGEQMEDYKAHVSPLQYEKTKLSYWKAIGSSKSGEFNKNQIANAWNDPAAFARSNAQSINGAFDLLTQQYQNDMESKGIPITREEAEVHTIASAGGQVPVFVKTLNDKFSNPNPVNLDGASRQVELLNQLNAENALIGLTPESKAMYKKYKAMRDSMDPVEAAQKAHEVVYGKSQATFELNAKKWTNLLSKKPQGQDPDVFVLKQVGLNISEMRSPTAYGNDILNEYETYFKLLNGDEVNAKNMLQESVDQNYGETYINGMKETTKHPIEKLLNLPHDATGVVQEDIIDQLNTKFDDNKKYYTGYKDEQGNDVKPSINEYWEVIPRNTTQDFLNHKEKNYNPNLIPGVNKPFSWTNSGTKLAEFKEGAPIEVVRHMRGGKSQKYKVVIQMSPFAQKTGNEDHPIQGGWDVSVDSGSGMRLLAREAPYLGIITYSPYVERIKSNYSALHLIRR